MTEPAGAYSNTAQMLAVEACAMGDALVFDASLGYWRVSSAANRASANALTQAVALRPYGGSAIGKVAYQSAGVLAQEVSGLPVLTPSSTKKLVRVSTAGQLERIDAYTDGDDVVGYVGWDGRAQLHLGLPWQLIAALGGIAALPDYSFQYRKPDGTLGGSTGVFSSAAGDALEMRTALETASSGAHFNFASTASARMRHTDTVTRTIFDFASKIGVFGGPFIGTRAGSVINNNFVSNWLSRLVCTGYLADGVTVSSVGAFAPASGTPATGFWNEYGGEMWPNAYLNGQAPKYPSYPFGHGDGIGCIADQRVAPTSAPETGSMFFRVRSAAGAFEVLFPGEDPTTGWHNLLDGGGSGVFYQHFAGSLTVAGGDNTSLTIANGTTSATAFTHTPGYAVPVNCTLTNIKVFVPSGALPDFGGAEAFVLVSRRRGGTTTTITGSDPFTADAVSTISPPYAITNALLADDQIIVQIGFDNSAGGETPALFECTVVLEFTPS